MKETDHEKINEEMKTKMKTKINELLKQTSSYASASPEEPAEPDAPEEPEEPDAQDEDNPGADAVIPGAKEATESMKVLADAEKKNLDERAKAVSAKIDGGDKQTIKSNLKDVLSENENEKDEKDEMVEKYLDLNYWITNYKGEEEAPPIIEIKDEEIEKTIWQPYKGDGDRVKYGESPNKNQTSNGTNKCWLNAPLYSILQNEFIQNRIKETTLEDEDEDEDKSTFVNMLKDLINEGTIWNDEKYREVINKLKDMKVEVDGASLPGLFPIQDDSQSREDYIKSVLGGTYHDASETLKFLKLALKKFLNIDIYYIMTFPFPGLEGPYVDCKKWDLAEQNIQPDFWRNCINIKTDSKLISLVQSYNIHRTGGPYDAGHFRSFIPIQQKKDINFNREDFNKNYKWIRVDALNGFQIETEDRDNILKDTEKGRLTRGDKAYSFYIFLNRGELDKKDWPKEIKDINVLRKEQEKQEQEQSQEQEQEQGQEQGQDGGGKRRVRTNKKRKGRRVNRTEKKNRRSIRKGNRRSRKKGRTPKKRVQRDERTPNKRVQRNEKTLNKKRTLKKRR